MTACFGDKSVRGNGLNGSFGLGVRKGNCDILADSFATVSLSAQHGTFQRMFLDLTRVQALLEFPSGSTFLSGAAHLAKDAYNSQPPKLETVGEICPKTTLSFQQQVNIFMIFGFMFVDIIMQTVVGCCFHLKKKKK